MNLVKMVTLNNFTQPVNDYKDSIYRIVVNVI